MRLREDDSLGAALDQLGLESRRPVLVVAGGAAGELDEVQLDARRRLVESAIVPVVREAPMTVITGGTDVGVMREIGRALAEHSPGTQLVGVAPDGALVDHGESAGENQAAVEPHHLMIRTDGGTFGDEAQVLVAVAERLGSDTVVLVAVGGGDGTLGEVRRALVRRWPVLLVEGLGGTSSELARGRWKTGDPGAEEMLAEARSEGRVRVEAVDDLPAVRRSLRWGLSPDDLLKEAWSRYAFADGEAKRLKRPTMWGARGVLGLGAFATSAALLVNRFAPGEPPWLAVKTVVVVLPLLAALVLALMQRSARAGSWVAMRGAAESLLREIYRFRSGAGVYAEHPAATFAESLAGIDARAGLRITDGRGAERPWPPDLKISPIDELLEPLTWTSYDAGRVRAQLSYLARGARTRKRLGMWWMVAASVAGIVTTASLALSFSRVSYWPNAVAAVAALLVAVAVSWRQYARYEEDADGLRAVATEISAVEARWMSLTLAERSEPRALAEYVAKIEEALAVENGEWERSVRQAQTSFFDRQGR